LSHAALLLHAAPSPSLPTLTLLFSLQAAATEAAVPTTPSDLANLGPTEAFAAWAAARTAARAAARGPTWAAQRGAPRPPVATPADAVRAAISIAPPTASFHPDGTWHTVTWGVDPEGVVDSDRIAVLWEPPPGEEEEGGDGGEATGGSADADAGLEAAAGPSPEAARAPAITPGGDPAVTRRDPIKYVFVSAAAPATWRAGRGSARVWLPPLRGAVRASYVRAGPTAATDGIWFEAGEVVHTVLTPTEPNAPAGVKLTGGVGGGGKADGGSLAAAPTAVAVTWQTRDLMAGGGVRWGLAGSALSAWAPAVCGDGTAAGAGALFSAPDGYCSRPANKKGGPWGGAALGAISRAVLAGLAPGTTYAYEVVAGRAAAGGGAGDGSARTVRGTFSTPPAARDGRAKTRLLFLADGGLDLPDGWDQPDGNVWPFASVALPAVQQTPGTAAYAAAQATLALLGGASVQPAAGRAAERAAALAAPETRAAAAANAATTPPPLSRPIHGVLFTGDISYARGEAAQWDAWSVAWGPALRAAPLLPAPGNHEAAGAPIFESLLETAPDDGGECGQAYDRLFGAPTPAGAGRWWYASRAGPLTILHLNSDQSLAAGSAQAAWLAAAAAAVDRGATPWLAVAIHRPLYSDNPVKEEARIAAELRGGIERVLVASAVDIVFSGHLHAYQRTCAAAKGRCYGGGGSTAASRPAPPAGVTPPIHIMAGGGGFRSPLTAWASAPAWVAAEARSYGLGELEVTRTRLALSVVSPVTGEVLDAAVLTKAAGWVAPDAGLAGAWCVFYFI